MESYDSMRGTAWKVCRSWFHAWNRMESYGSYASMHEIAWKPYELDPGSLKLRVVSKQTPKTI